jgi:hypothetical protein
LFLTLLDSQGRIVGPVVVGHGRLPDYAGVDIEDYIKVRWIRLQPGHFYGRSAPLPIVGHPKPGKYIVTALYQSALRGRLSTAQQRQLDAMGSAVLQGRLEAQAVSIEILP